MPNVNDGSAEINEYRTDLSEMSSEDMLDIPVPVKYTCTILFTPLSLTDHISDPAALPPGSETYNQFAMNQPPPFRLIATVSLASSLGPICLEEIFGAPYMAVVKGNDQILFKALDMEGHSTLTCSSVNLPNRVRLLVIACCFPLTLRSLIGMCDCKHQVSSP